MKKIISNRDVEEMIDGIQRNNLLREGLCGIDMSSWDLSNLDYEHFKLLCFDENTVFSQEQQEKFHPERLLKYAKEPMKELKSLHVNGNDGRGIIVAIIDTDINRRIFETLYKENFTYIDNENKGEIEPHGGTVLSSFMQTAPNASVQYYPSNKQDAERHKHLIEYIEQIAQSGVKIISLSTSLVAIINNKQKLEYINKVLEEYRITLIDSDKFYENFTYCFRNIDEGGIEKFNESLCEGEDVQFENIWKNIKNGFKILFSKYGVSTIEELKEKLEQAKIVEELKLVQEFEPIAKYTRFSEGENMPLHFLKQRDKQRERSKRKKVESIEIPCGGRTLNGKYWGTSSASYTIPVVAGMFAICKQVNNSISYEDFVKYCKETSKKIDGRYLIQPQELIEKVRNNKQVIVSNDITQGIANEHVIDDDTISR